jgi:hypothetical protein
MILRLLKDLITETEHSEPSTVKQEQDTYGNYDTKHIVDYYARGVQLFFPLVLSPEARMMLSMYLSMD